MITMEWTMDTGVLFLIVVAGVAIGEYLAQFMLYKTAVSLLGDTDHIASNAALRSRSAKSRS